tara:strand:- start:5491 stop:9291 length:3801 start_codon:yes stop_codon:yes gene_type:complete
MSDTFLNILETTQLNRSVGKSFAYTDPLDGKVKETPGEMPLPFDKGYPAGIEPGSDAAMEYDVYRSNFTKIPDFSLSDDYIAARRKDKQGTELTDPIWLAASNQLYRHFYNQGGVVAAGMDDPSTLTPREMGEWGAEFMLRFNYNLPYMVFNATAGLDMPPSVASSMYYLMETADREGISGLNFAKGFGYAMLDPTSWVGAATFGIGIAGKMAGKKATKAGFKAMLKDIILAPTSKPAMFEGALAGVHSAAANYIEQDVKVDAGKQEKISVPELGASAAVGVVAGEEFVRMGSPLGAKVIEKGKEVYKDVKDKVTATISEEDGNVKVEAALDDEEQVAKEMDDKTVESTGPEIDQDKSVGAAGINENILLTELDKDGFYSQLLAKAKDLSPRLNTGNIKGQLINMGVKEEEIRWVGVNDFIDELKAKNNGQDVSFDKKDLVDYIRDNQVRITTRKAGAIVEGGEVTATNTTLDAEIHELDYYDNLAFEQYMSDNVGKPGANIEMSNFIDNYIDDLPEVKGKFEAWMNRNLAYVSRKAEQSGNDRQPEEIFLDQFEETGKEDMLEAQKSIYGEINYQDRPKGYNEVLTQFLMDSGEVEYKNFKNYIIGFGAQNADDPNVFAMDIVMDGVSDEPRQYDEMSGYYIFGNSEMIHGVFRNGARDEEATRALNDFRINNSVEYDDYPRFASWLNEYAQEQQNEFGDVFDYNINATTQRNVDTDINNPTGTEPMGMKYSGAAPDYLDDFYAMTLSFADPDKIAEKAEPGGMRIRGGRHFGDDEFVHIRFGTHSTGVGPNAMNLGVIFEIQSDVAQQYSKQLRTKKKVDEYNTANIEYRNAIMDGTYKDPLVKVIFNNQATADVPETMFDITSMLSLDEPQFSQMAASFVSGGRNESAPFLIRTLVEAAIKKKHNFLEPASPGIDDVRAKNQYFMQYFDDRFETTHSVTRDNLHDALQDNVDQFYDLLPDSVLKLSMDEYQNITKSDVFRIDGKKFSEIPLRDRAKVGDYIIQYYRKNGKLPPQVGLKYKEDEQELIPQYYLQSALTSTELLYRDYFLKAFQSADESHPYKRTVIKDWNDVISTDDVYAFAYLKPTLELIKVKNNIHKEVSEESISALAKGEPIYQEEPFINNVEKASTAALKRGLYEIVMNDPDEKLTHLVLPTLDYARTIPMINLKPTFTFYDKGLPKVLQKTIGEKGELVPANEVFDSDNAQFNQSEANSERVKVRIIELTPELRARIKKGFALFTALPAALMGKEIITNNQGQDDGNST